ncbi:hypothetical protein HY490_01850 [Candidatus Woesearchaeota archaeon]|nr:hypothetical protein [Candidatus Woesearchaeota archaeon]
MKRKHSRQPTPFVWYGLVIVVLAVLVYSLAGLLFPQAEVIPLQIAENTSETPTGFIKITTGDTGQGNVEIALTPQGFVDRTLRVSIEANTHSVDLSPFDLKQSVQLEYDGKVLRPLSAPLLSGHHASGTLVFEGVDEIQQFTIVITGIPAVERRVFTWRKTL